MVAPVYQVSVLECRVSDDRKTCWGSRLALRVCAVLARSFPSALRGGLSEYKPEETLAGSELR